MVSGFVASYATHPMKKPAKVTIEVQSVEISILSAPESDFISLTASTHRLLGS